MMHPSHPSKNVFYKHSGHWLHQLGVILVLLGFGLLGFNWLRPEHGGVVSEAEKTAQKSCQVLSVYDGDTLACDLNENHQIDKPTEQIRMIGIDTPEMHYSHKNKTGEDEPGAQAASEFTQSTLKNQRVTLEHDEQQEDKYGRTLAYVYLQGQSVSINEQLLAKGLATHFFIPPNTRYESLFLEAEIQAQEKKLGLWATTLE
jgi:micrococcal nuclease